MAKSYGHHFRYGDMALAYALSILLKTATDIEADGIYAEHLEKHPPPPTRCQKFTRAAPGVVRTGWNVGRVIAAATRVVMAAGTSNGATPLRNAMDLLRDRLAPILYETGAAHFLKDPWAARDDYIEVILNRSAENIAAFFDRQATHKLDDAGVVTALRFLEMQRHAMLMYTSCGWFFDEISGPETVQVIQYAARTIQLARELAAEDVESGFLEILGQAKSNIPENQDGRVVYEKFVNPAVMTREKVAAHYAISSLFESYPEEARI